MYCVFTMESKFKTRYSVGVPTWNVKLGYNFTSISSWDRTRVRITFPPETLELRRLPINQEFLFLNGCSTADDHTKVASQFN